MNLTTANYGALLRENNRLLTEVARLAVRLERDAGTVAVPRELLEECLEDMRDLRGEHDWHKDEPRCGHAAEYARLSERIARIETMLAGDGALGDGK